MIVSKFNKRFIEINKNYNIFRIIMTWILTGFILSLGLSLASTQAADSKCYALALSSGDQSAAYQAGVLSGLYANLPLNEIQYDSISAVSGGAVNGVLLASYPEGQE